MHDVDGKIDLSVAPMATHEVQARLDSLHEYDSKIIKLLDTASQSVQALQQGKRAAAAGGAANMGAAKTTFEQTSKEYFQLLEQISVGLRNEIRMLHRESKEKVLPLSLAAKADWIGEQKERQVWEAVDDSLKEINPAHQSQESDANMEASNTTTTANEKTNDTNDDNDNDNDATMQEQ